jgi:hypothetical protein
MPRKYNSRVVAAMPHWASGLRDVPYLFLLGERFLGGSVYREEFRQSRNLHYRVTLFRQCRQRKTLSFFSPMNKNLHQRPHSRGIHKRHPAHIQRQLRGRLCPQRLDKSMHSLKAQLSLQPRHDLASTFSRQSFQIKLWDGHKPVTLAQNPRSCHCNPLVITLSCLHRHLPPLSHMYYFLDT